MSEHQIGTVAALFRYPVKSMLGERLGEFALGPGGVIGDRAWALRELANGRIVSGKKWRNTFEFSAAYEPGSSAPVITLPDGRKIATDAPGAAAMLSAAFGARVEMARAAADQTWRAAFDPAMVFGDVPFEQMMPALQQHSPVDAGPDDWGMPKGTFFDVAPLHLLATGTLARLGRLNPETRFDERRFRPNLLIDAGSGGERFVEDDWVGGMLRIGAAAITVTAPVVRCVMTTHRQADLPRDLAVLRTVAQHRQALVGVYAEVAQPGGVRVGDPVTLIK